MNTVKIGSENGVATISLNRPEQHNAFNEEMMEELRQAFARFDQDRSIRVIVLRGEGKSFCAGADLNYMKSASKKSFEDNVSESLAMASMFQIIKGSSKPVVALVHGAILGGGVGLIAAADLVLAETGTRFGFSEVKLGLAPSVISPFVIEKIGPSHARRLFLTGEIFDTKLALRIGLVHEVYEKENADKLLAFVCENLLQNSPNAIAEIKDLIDSNVTLSGEELANFTAEHISHLRTLEQGQEGMTAFFEKRKPNYSK